jgi:hypothetical protein
MPKPGPRLDALLAAALIAVLATDEVRRRLALGAASRYRARPKPMWPISTVKR